MRLTAREAAILFAIGAAGGLVGDAAHVVTGTTTYLDRGVPFIWESAIWFVVAVGLATVATGELRLRLGDLRTAGDAGETIAAIAAVIAIYAVTALTSDRPEGASTTLVICLAALTAVRFAGSRADLICGAGAAIGGPLAEILIVNADIARYAPSSDGLLGVGLWLPALYFAFGVVAARLAELIRAGRLVSPPARR